MGDDANLEAKAIKIKNIEYTNATKKIAGKTQQSNYTNKQEIV